VYVLTIALGSWLVADTTAPPPGLAAAAGDTQ
jgi:hypothetical protein